MRIQIYLRAWESDSLFPLLKPGVSGYNNYKFP